MAVDTQSLKVPKRIPVELIRKVLGDKETERLLIGGYGPVTMRTPVVKIEKQTFENMLAILNGDLEANVHLMPPIFRAYFAAVPFTTNRMKRWIKEQLAMLETGDQIPGVTIKGRSPAINGPRKKRKK